MRAHGRAKTARPQRHSVVGLANEKVPIALAGRLIGMDIPEGWEYGRAIKVHCPFGEIYHIDQGHEAAMRLYPDTNSAFCFAGCGFFTPVRLVVHAWDAEASTVAVELLDRVGVKPVSLAQAWAQAVHREPPPDATLLAEALKTFCRRTCPAWGQAQFHPAIAARLTRCLALLDHVCTDAQAGDWLAACKQVMTITLTTQRMDT